MIATYEIIIDKGVIILNQITETNRVLLVNAILALNWRHLLKVRSFRVFVLFLYDCYVKANRINCGR